ncbi:hypothetical protein IMCC12053_2625 [Celeribacter marinus]|uniref:Uncharacterized protein n=1 Tax=Celeribacter marinus TaxID=1397108 RepID=A0A0N9ZLK5_9RHOB|nr:hypothetical protein IMCC12053_2625 [Celeribacter marinus]
MIDAFVGWQEPAKAIADKGAMAVISSKSNAKMRIPHNRDLYAMLNLVEWFFLQNERHAKAYKTYEKSNEMTSPLSTSSRSSFS